MTFLAWLVSEKEYSERASRDVQSRLKRALRFSGQESVTDKTLVLIEENDAFQALSMSVKSQMRRAIRLQQEFNSKM